MKNINLLHTPIFDVVELPEFKSNFKPIAVKAPDWTSIIVEKDKKFLMVKQFRHGFNGMTEEFPCGQVEISEDPKKAAIRELTEETGYVVPESSVVFLGKNSPNPAFMTNRMHFFYVNLDKIDYVQLDQKLDENEEIEFFWKDKDKVIDAFLASEESAIVGCALFRFLKFDFSS